MIYTDTKILVSSEPNRISVQEISSVENLQFHTSGNTPTHEHIPVYVGGKVVLRKLICDSIAGFYVFLATCAPSIPKTRVSLIRICSRCIRRVIDGSQEKPKIVCRLCRPRRVLYCRTKLCQPHRIAEPSSFWRLERLVENGPTVILIAGPILHDNILIPMRFRVGSFIVGPAQYNEI